MKKKSTSLIAFLLAASLTFSPLSYIRAYATETESREEISESSGEGTEKEEQPKTTAESKEEESAEEESTEEESADAESKEKAESTEVSESGEAEPEESSEGKEEESKEASESAEESEKAAASTEEESEASTEDTGISSEGSRKEESTASGQNFIPKTDALLAVNRIAVFSLERTIVPTPSAEITGVTVLKWDADSQSHAQYGMFPVTVTSMAVSGETIRISFHTGAQSAFDWLYFGNPSDENKTADFVGTKEESTCKFEIEVPVSKRNSWLPMVLGCSDKGIWSDDNLWMSIPDVPVITKQPQKAEAKVGETVALSVEVTGEGLTYQWQFMADGGETWADCEGESAKTAAYDFEMAETLAGQYRCVITDKNGVKAESDAVEVFVAEEKPEDDGFKTEDGISAVYGENSGKHQSGDVYSMFSIETSEAVVKGKQIEVTIWVKPASSGNYTYDAIYIGDKNDTKTEPVEPIYLGEVDPEKNCQKYTFTVPYSAKGTSVSFVPRKTKDGKWSNTTALALTIPSTFDISPDEGKETTGGINAIYGEDSGKHQSGDVYSMFSIETSEAVVKGKQIEVTIWVKPASSGNYTYDAIYIGDKNDTKTEPVEPIYLGEVDPEKNCQKYTFTVPYSAKGTSVSFVPRKAKDGKWSNTTALALTIPSVFSAPVSLQITTQPADIIVIAGATVSLSVEAEGEGLTYQWQFSADGIVWTDCTGESAKTAELTFMMTEETAGQYRCAITDKNGKEAVSNAAVIRKPVAPILTGSDVKVVKEDGGSFKMFQVNTSQVTADGESLEVIITTNNLSFDKFYLGYKDDSLKTPVIAGTPLAEGGWSFEFTVPASCKGETLPITLGYPTGSAKDWYVGQYLWIYIPDEGITELPEAVNEIQAITGGTGISYKDFQIVSSRAVLKQNQVLLTLTVNGNKWTRLYQGVQADTNKTPFYSGTYDEASDTTTFTFAVPAGKQGMNIPVTPGTESSWFAYARDLFINVPRLEEVAKTSDNGIYELYGSAFPIINYAALHFERESSLTINGDTATVTLITQTNHYDKIYIGSVDDLDSVKNAGAAEAVARTDIGDAYKCFTFTIPTADLGKEINYVVHIQSSDSWAVKQSSFRINEILEKIGSLPGGDPDPEPTPDPEIPADGIYRIPVESSASMFKVVDCVLTVKNGKMSAVLTLSGTGYDYLYPGTKEEAAAAASSAWSPYVKNNEGKYTYTIPVEGLDKGIAVAAHSISKNIWYDRTLTFKSEGMEKLTPAVENGIYGIEVESSASMFKVVDCVLTVKDGKMSAVLTLSGTGYDYLYPGTKEEAAAAASSAWSPYVKNAEGKYTYTIPVEGLDKGIAVAAHSISKNIWYDRILTFKSDTLKKLSDLPGGSGTPGTTPTDPTDPSDPGNTGIDDPETTIPDNDGKEDQESQYVSDTSGSTGRIDSSTTLADGVYKPDKFSWSGGTGKVKISCNKITVKNGQAYATLVFSSDSYQYVKANGNTYYASKSGGQATVVIPVALNKNNRILGMTTKMSATHEIEYNIFIYLAAAGNGQTVGENSNEKLDEEAPEIMGLEYKSETELDFAEYFKIYHYDQGIVLLEIDMTRDTARDPEKLAESENSEDKADKKETEKKAEKADEGEILPEEEGEITVSQNEIAAELYKGNVVKYLLVPENVEIPVGLEQDMIIVTLPLDRTYAASDEILEIMESLDLLDQVAAVGCEQKDCKVDTVAERMKVRDGEKEADVVYGGLFDAPDFKALIKQEINLAILPGTLLPRDEEDPDIQDSTVKKNTDSAAKKNTGNEQELTAEEQTERLESLTEKFAMFGIPVVIDRSADEETELAKYEWIKVYGVLFGCEEEMDELFETAVKKAEQQESRR